MARIIRVAPARPRRRRRWLIPTAAPAVGDATVTPAAIACTVALPQTAVGVGVAPAVTPAVVALPLPTSVGQTGDATVTPAAISAVVALPAAQVSVGVAPAVIATLVSLPQTAVGVGAAPAAVAVVVTLPPVTIAVHALAQPAVIGVVVALPQPAVGVGVAPAVVALVVVLPAPLSVGELAVNVNPPGPVMVGAILTASSLFGTRPSSVVGGGFQNAGCFAPTGIGHQWVAISGGDVGGFAVTTDGLRWTPANTNLNHRNKMRVSCVEGSRTTPNRIYGYTSSNDGLGANAGFLLRGSFDPAGSFDAATGYINWTQVALLADAARAGNVGDNHPRQVGRTMALDEANDVAVVGTINGLAVITLSTGAVAYRALAGHHVTGVVLDPTDTQLCYCTVDDDGGANQAGVHRVVNIRSGAVSSTRYDVLTNPQDIVLVTAGGSRYCYVAAMQQGIRRWTVGADITAGWTDLTGTLVTTQGYAGVDARDAASLSTVTLLASTAETGQTSVDGGAYSTDGGTTWQRESLAWTVSSVVVGQTEAWWMAAPQPQALLGGNTYEATTPRINPADPADFHIHGRAGVWRSVDGGANWQPTVNGLCVTGGFAVAVDPQDPARAVVGDNDWTMFRTTSKFLTMADQEEPGGVSGRSVFDFAFRPSGRLALACGNAPTNTLGEVYTTDNPWDTTPTYTSQGFGTAGGGARCKAVAIGQDAAATEVLLAVVEGSGIYRKVGAAAPTLVSTLVQATQATTPRFWWPQGGTDQHVYCSAAEGLLRSADYGATWTSIWSYTQGYEYVGGIDGDPTTPTTLYLTVDDNASNVGLYKVTGAAGTPTITRIGPTADPPGQCAVHPLTGQVFLATTYETPGGPRLWRSPAANPDAAAAFVDITDLQWAAGAMAPRDLVVAADGTVYFANAIGGYFVAQTAAGVGAMAPPGGMAGSIG
jgi:hypothetical protein